jgi:hypothetical protein
MLTVGTLDIRLDATLAEFDKFDIILGQPWLQGINPDIGWSTKPTRDRKTCETMVCGDAYTVPVIVHHLEADAIVRLQREQLTYLFVIGLRGVQYAVDDIKTDQHTEWTTSLRDSVKELTDIIKELDGLPPTRECDFEINLECDQSPKERTYRMSPPQLQEVKVQLQNLLAKGWIRPSKSLYGARFYLYARRTVPCVCA